MLHLFLSILTLCAAAFLYFRGKIGMSLFFLFAFYGLGIWVATDIFFPQHRVIFFLLTGILVFFPISLLLAFFMDVRYGWFCFDMSYSWAFVWGFAFIFLGINLVGKTIACLVEMSVGR